MPSVTLKVALGLLYKPLINDPILTRKTSKFVSCARESKLRKLTVLFSVGDLPVEKKK